MKWPAAASTTARSHAGRIDETRVGRGRGGARGTVSGRGLLQKNSLI